ncbi:SsgA family sporulation/cell division regulator [Actinomadura sp. ATCC 39365]
MKTILRRPLVLWDVSNHDTTSFAASIIYRPNDPFAVTIMVSAHGAGDAQEFVFSRALLIDGLEQPTGDGTVRVEPHAAASNYVIVTLTVGGTRREFFAERAPLESFIDNSLRRVPLGGELAPASRELDRWLAEVTA